MADRCSPAIAMPGRSAKPQMGWWGGTHQDINMRLEQRDGGEEGLGEACLTRAVRRGEEALSDGSPVIN